MIIYGENLEATIKKKFSQKERNKNKSSKKKKKKNEDDEEAGENDEINNIVGGQEAEVDLNISLIHKIIDEDLLVKNHRNKNQ